MKKVLILNPTFYPGYRAGGPQQTVKNICDTYSDKCSIYLITKNRDFGSTVPYDVPVDEWLERYNINIKYEDPKRYGWKVFSEAYGEFDTIYSCGLFCKNSYELLLIHKLFKKNDKQLYIAPMGVFSKGAIGIKNRKKKLFLKVCTNIGLFDDIIWSFTSEKERADAEEQIPGQIKKYIIAEDLPGIIDYRKQLDSIAEKERNHLRLVFLSRISPMKNLEACIKILDAKFDGTVTLDIYGTMEDETYWNKCMSLTEKLPENVSVCYKGEVKPDEAVATFGRYDAFLFPTKGENYGHVIYESLAGGCVPIISDKTPWTGFEEKQCGYIYNLEDLSEFRKAIEMCMKKTPAEYHKMKRKAILYAEEKYRLSIDNSGYNAVFL